MKATQNKIYINRSFNCSVTALYKWLVDPALIIQWFGPQGIKVHEVTTDLKIGGTYEIKLTKPDGSIFSIWGEYLEIKEPSKLIFNFKYKGILNAPPKSIVEITLEQIDTNKSNLFLVQQFESTPRDIENRTRSWESMFVKLKDRIQLTTKT